MIRLFNCITVQHDLLVLGLAAFVCVAMSVVCSIMLSRMNATTGLLKRIWIAGTALILSAGIWTTHFISMLAYEPGVGFVFDVFWTVTSLGISILFNLTAIALIAANRPWLRLLGATTLGLGIGAMHYSGMSGIIPDGIKEWDSIHVIASLVCGVGLSILYIELHRRAQSLRMKAITGLVLVLAICGAHFIGMSALTLIPHLTQSAQLLGIKPSTLAFEIAAVAVLIMQAAFGVAILDGRLSKVREENADKMRESEERYHLALKGSSDGVWDWDLKTGDLYCSEGFDQYFGKNAFPTVGHFFAAIHPEDKEWVNASYRAHFKDRGKYDQEYRIRCADGDYRWFRIKGNAVWDINDRAVRMVGSFTDIQVVKLAREKTEEARRASEEASRMKSEFLANMSHEIRTPLNGILGMAQLMERTELNAKQKRFNQTIISSGTSLLSIINDVLDISKIEAGLVELHEDWFDLQTLLEDAIDAVRGIVETKGLFCRFDNRLGQDIELFGDVNRIRQILINLAGNAAKFTDEGGVTITVARTKNKQIGFVIRDTGPGIADDQIDLIFSRFRQADGSPTRKHGGTGLGLAISKDFVEMMHGKIGVASKIGVGSKFWFMLPLESRQRGDDVIAA